MRASPHRVWFTANHPEGRNHAYICCPARRRQRRARRRLLCLGHGGTANTTVPPDIIFIDEGNCGITLPDGREILNGQGVQRVVFGGPVLGDGGIFMITCWGPTPPGMITETLHYTNVEVLDPTPDWACRFTVTPRRWSVACGP